MPRHPHPLTTRVRRRKSNRGVGSPLPRQWELLQQLSFDPQGVTVKGFAQAAGVDLKTVRRDLTLLQRLGFDLKETVEKHGRKSWRVRHPIERLRSRRQQYRLIRDSLVVLTEQAQAIGDRRLADALEAVRKTVGSKGE